MSDTTIYEPTPDRRALTEDRLGKDVAQLIEGVLTDEEIPDFLLRLVEGLVPKTKLPEDSVYTDEDGLVPQGFLPEGLPIIARDRGILPGTAESVGPALQLLLTESKNTGRPIHLEPKEYNVGTTALGFNGGERLVAVGRGPNRFTSMVGKGATLKWSAAGTMLGVGVVVNSSNVWWQGITFDFNEAQMTGIRALGGFEGRYEDSRAINARGVGLHIRAVSNTSYQRFYVDNCGTATLYAVQIDSISHSINTLDFRQVHIERSVNGSLHVGPTTWDGDGAAQKVPELLVLEVHIESVSDNGGTPNVDAMLKITLARLVLITNSRLVGGPGPLIEHDFAGGTVYDTAAGGIVLSESFLLGRDGEFKPTNLVKLTRGTRFAVSASVFDNCTSHPIAIAATYGPSALVGLDNIKGARTGGGSDLVQDLRAVRDPYRIVGDFRISGTVTVGALDVSTDARIRGHANITSAPPTAAVGAAAGADAPAPLFSRPFDQSGKLFFGSGTAPGAGAQVVVTFSKTFLGEVPVVLAPGNAATALQMAKGYYVATTATTWTLFWSVAPAASLGATTFQVNYTVGS